MVEVILLQIPSPIREALWVLVANHSDRVVYAEHVLLHHLVLLLLDFIQGPYHGIVVALVTECLLHVHQQILHRDTLAFIQHVSPLPSVPTETGKDVRVHACLIILLEEGIHIEPPECVHHLCPWIGQLGISNLVGASHFFSLLPLWPLHLCQRPAVSLAVEYPLESGAPLSGEEGGEPPPPTTVHWDLGGHLCGHTAPVWEVSLASATSSTAEALPACWGALPTSWPEESAPLHSRLEYYGLGSQPDPSAFGGWKQQPLTTTPPSEERG